MAKLEALRADLRSMIRVASLAASLRVYATSAGLELPVTAGPLTGL